MKRLFDMLVSGAGLIVFAPVAALIALGDQARGRRAGVLHAGARRQGLPGVPAPSSSGR